MKDIEKSNQTIIALEKKIYNSRGILNDKDRDFSISNPSSFQATIPSTLNTISLFLVAIAAISLLAGAVGIANTMFTSVLEKTKEIGIMKAIGARNKDILMIFILNAALIGFVGGCGGIILGVIFSLMIGSSSGISASGAAGGPRGINSLFSNSIVTPEIILFALLFSISIGIIAGAIPAYRASRLKPVDALRYE
ncbi:hypothetical protein COU57_03855 [Candidatus Pacearchaeota archaeon CG10_big_fil_rev_8_21_14_0_10_32_14]|nr:MAG: hypothetical protein COU57_03855 [Candidatus Pacearchaeota archaeon CG10_big_fil_rev_8_21_14_0_10_32_14]